MRAHGRRATSRPGPRACAELTLASPDRDMRPPRKRADLLLVDRGLFESRARAQAAIEAGLVTANDKPVLKPSESIAADAVLQATTIILTFSCPFSVTKERAPCHRLCRCTVP